MKKIDALIRKTIIIDQQDGVPVIQCFYSKGISESRFLISFFCEYCKAYHHHLEEGVKIKSHCYKGVDSPLREYILRVEPSSKKKS